MKCKHVVHVNFKTGERKMCDLCSKQGFHPPTASFDVNAKTIKGQKSIRKKFIDFSLAKTVDIEEFVNRFDAVIPTDQHYINNMTGYARIIDDEVVYYLDVEFYDPDLKQKVHQSAYIAKSSLSVFFISLQNDPLVRSDLKLSELLNGDTIFYNEYVKNKIYQSDSKGAVVTEKFKSKLAREGETNVVYLNPDLHSVASEVQRKFKDNPRNPRKARAANFILIGAVIVGLVLSSYLAFGLA